MKFDFEGKQHTLFTNTFSNDPFYSGIAFAMYGNTAGISQDFQVEIDGNPPYTSSTTDSSPQNWMQWYQSPQLSEGTHSVNISGNRAIAFDVMIITPGPKTSLTGQTLLVDDSYEHISYEGAGWKQFSGTKYMSTTTVKALPIGNGTHQTSNIGDSLQFTYSGIHFYTYRGLRVLHHWQALALGSSVIFCGTEEEAYHSPIALTTAHPFQTSTHTKLPTGLTFVTTNSLTPGHSLLGDTPSR